MYIFNYNQLLILKLYIINYALRFETRRLTNKIIYSNYTLINGLATILQPMRPSYIKTATVYDDYTKPLIHTTEIKRN